MEADDTQPAEQWSTEQRREFRQALEVRRRRQLRGGQIIAGLLIVIVATGVLLRLAALVFRLANWKCPACAERLPTRGSGKTCPGCGLPLE